MKLAADANVLLSAVVGGRARDILTHPGVEEVLTTSATMGEVQEYLAQLARKRRLSIDTVLLAAATLPVSVVERTAYAAKLGQAAKRLEPRDPDDVELLALALHLGLAVWSNDNDFEDAGVEWYTTAELPKALGR